MSNFNILVIEDQEGLQDKSTYRVDQTATADSTKTPKNTKMRKILNSFGLREIVWVINLIILVIVVITTAISINRLNFLDEKVEDLTKFMAYERINDLGYFQKLPKKMNYAEGQIACSQIFGHVVEFKWDGTKCGFLFQCKYLLCFASKIP